MKKYFKFSAGFIGLYLFFMISLMPLSFVSQWLELPKNVAVGKVSGSIWQGEITSLVVDGVTIIKLEAELSFFCLLILKFFCWLILRLFAVLVAKRNRVASIFLFNVNRIGLAIVAVVFNG